MPPDTEAEDEDERAQGMPAASNSWPGAVLSEVSQKEHPHQPRPGGSQLVGPIADAREAAERTSYIDGWWTEATA